MNQTPLNIFTTEYYGKYC